MRDLLRLKLQFFNDTDEFDFAKFDEQFEQEYQEEEVEENAETSEQETTDESGEETTEETEENTEEPTESEEETTDEEVDEGEGSGESEQTKEPTDNKLSEEEHRRNEAFKNLREQAQEREKYEQFVKQVADMNNMTPEQVMQQFEEQRLQQEAQRTGDNPETLKRVRELEEAKKQSEQQALRERFNNQAKHVMDTFGISADDMKGFIREASERGFDLYNNDMETVYRGLRHDDIVKAEVEKARQKELEEKKKRQTQSAPAHNGSTTNDDGILDGLDKEVKSEIESW